jgi:hypothetical protein
VRPKKRLAPRNGAPPVMTAFVRLRAAPFD